ncbi:hypothetical protein T265_07198 [Opisthorchis viverrini]|uniref:Uncharacterized protein n=1 Tax=Opisthorchis viverrini TaxID=6198 RepID=A0A074ZHT5_OPIVI|nr:hypothetical protein T265_07198 [Opisthorchis viverrini]KER25322.1 hypothetical protein T265_07198 [Opisthorchis viverrini]
MLTRLQSTEGARWPKWFEREFTDRKVRGSNPTSATRLPCLGLGNLARSDIANRRSQQQSLSRSLKVTLEPTRGR